MLGIVIVNYNDAKTTKRLLDNIKDYQILDKIVVVDNNSTDNSLKELKKYNKKKIEIIENKKNLGYAAALNIGAKKVVEELGKCHIIFSNSDVIINGEDSLLELSKTISKKIKVVGPTIVEGTNLNRGWKLPSIRDEIRANVPILSRRWNKELLYGEEHYEKDISIVDVVSGCFFLVDSKALEAVKFFDEKTFLYYEENILAAKMKKKGYEEAVCNKVVILHDHAKTIDKNYNSLKKYNILKNSQEYFAKEYLKASEKDLKKIKKYRKLYTLLKYRKVEEEEK
ncbi:MAG: glycosyltransferase family 2 protein [Bacilli bacterium]|nr:glycosyltransferase family 2 protein [Bacilli bacterium]